MNILPFETRVQIAAALVEGMSIRSVERLVGVHRDSIMRFGITIGEACDRLHDRLVRDVRPSCLQLDEAWTFVSKKEKRCTDHDPSEFGDQYVFVALDSTTKLVISYRVDKRTMEATRAFVGDLRMRVLGSPTISTDAFRPYFACVAEAFGTAEEEANHGVVVKSYATSPGGAAAVRYSPGRVIRADYFAASGSPEEICTSFVERSNLTLRTQIRRMTRLCSGFSKRVRNLRAAIGLHHAQYNFCRVHETLRTMTPAMAAGLTDRPWSIAELLETALAESTPKRPSTPPTAPPRKPVREPLDFDGGPIPIGNPTRVPFLRIVRGGAS